MSEVMITRLDLDAGGLRLAASRSRDASASRRMLALALVLEGSRRLDAARTCGMDRQTLRDWVHRYNEQGLAGLSDARRTGRPPRLQPDQLATLAGWVRAGPDPVKDGIVRWRRADLAAKVAADLGVVVAGRTMGKILHRLGFAHLSARPRHPEADPAAQTAHKKTSSTWSPPASPLRPGASPSNSGGRMKRASASRAR